MQPLISIITVNYNSLEATCGLLESIRRTDYGKVEVILVDNGSDLDPGAFIKKQYPEIHFIRSEKNLGFAGGNNLGIHASKGEYLFFLNNDAVLTDGTIAKLLQLFQEIPSLGIVSPKICYYNETPGESPDIIQYAGSTHLNPFTGRNRTLGERQIDEGQFNRACPTAYPHGAAMMAPRKVIDKVGAMPEEFFLYYEELDWCEQIRKAGFEIYVEPNAKIYHQESCSVGKASAFKTYYLNRNRILFVRRNRKGWQIAAFWMFLLIFALPKNALLFILKGEWEHLRAFLEAIVWNLNRRIKNRPVSAPLTFFTPTA